MNDSFTAEIKAKLISIGSVRLDPTLERPEYVGRSTAGPGAGGRSVFFSADSRRVRLSIRENSPLIMKPEGDGVIIEHEGFFIARGFIEPVGAHCPHQAYITVSERCKFRCAFCPVHHIQGPVKSPEEVFSLIHEVNSRGFLEAISLTTGIEISPEHEVTRMEGIVKLLRKEFDVPIGVSVYPTHDSSERMYAAGADEVKYNVETMDRALFPAIFPDQNLDFILNALRDAACIFGKNHVSSNIIIGLGEDDQTVISGVSELASFGVIPVLRPVVIHPSRPMPGTERPSADRLLHLGYHAKAEMSRYGISHIRQIFFNYRIFRTPARAIAISSIVLDLNSG